MKNLTNRFVSFMLVFALALSLSAPAFAADVPTYTSSTFTSVPTTEEPNIETRSVATSAVKKAIRWALRHSDDLIKSAAKWIGDDAAAVVEKNFAKAVPVLNNLLKYDTLVWETVQDQLTHVVGRQAAIWIRMALEWLL